MKYLESKKIAPMYEGLSKVCEAGKKHKMNLSILVAETSLWASPEVHKRLVKENKDGAWFPGVRRYQPGEERRKIYRNVLTGKDEMTDDNSKANIAIKKAIGIPNTSIFDFATCHIWPDTARDVRYHTAIANLVLIPTPLAGLSDYHPDVMAALQFRAYELYKWHPKGCNCPVRPPSYPKNWLEPMPFNDLVQRALDKNRTF